ncbi:MAG: hypothetical protein NXI22_09915 [bacterium]|nr:hypothetical protein [bacterium]
MNQRQKTAAQIEAEQDAEERRNIETNRPYSASAHEVRALADHVNRIQELADINHSMMKTLMKHTGFISSDDETLVETVHTNAEHISECLQAFNRRIIALETHAAENRTFTDYEDARLFKRPSLTRRILNFFTGTKPDVFDKLPEDDIPF